MYEIRPETIKTFITDRAIKLPRFQRKQTWDDKKNFQLCISVFKNYPMGVCILSVDEEKGRTVRELLDGRQRRNALTLMYENPENIYLWAKKFIGFKNTDHPLEIHERFMTKINEYLEADDADLTDEEINDDREEPNEVNDVQEFYNPIDGKDGLELLFYIVEMVHNNYSHGTGFTRPFDFSQFAKKLSYIESINNGKKYSLSGKNLKLFIDEYRNYCDASNYEYADEESFFTFVKNRSEVNSDSEKALQVLIHQNWKNILARINLIDRIDGILNTSKIGLIEVKNLQPADSQKIFNIINSEGVKLTAAEILSAKPHWNRKIKNPSAQLVEATKELYRNMGLTVIDVVRWDIPATLLSRFDHNVIYKDLSWDSKNQKTDFEKKLTLGFKILSGIYEKGVKKDDIEKFGTDKDIDWEADVESVINDLGIVIKLIEDYSYFSFLKSWKTSIMELTSDAIAMNFLLTAYFDWIRKNKTIGSNKQTKLFQKNCFIIWDRLIYEYVSRLWRGSSDSTIANNISAIGSKAPMFEPVNKEEWTKLLKEIFDKSEVKGVDVSIALMKPILYHMYCLKEISAPDSKYSIEVDHIIPQSIFKGSSIKRNTIVQDNLYNLGLLPKNNNISKSDKKLTEIDDAWLKNQIKQYEFIEEKDYQKYSNINNYIDLFKKRKKIFDEAFTDCRDNLINN
jgi:hypothetical protein